MKIIRYFAEKLGKWLTFEKKKRIPHNLCNFERIRFELKPGDVILVDGRSRVAGIIKTITESTWSHSALYIGKVHDIEDKRIREIATKAHKNSKNEPLIVESELGEGTTIKSINHYQREHIRICRPNGLSHRDVQQIINYAVSRLGNEYDLRHILDIMRFLLPYKIIPAKWSSSLFNYYPGQATKTVCSCMVAEAFSFIHFPILPLVKVEKDNQTRLYQRNPKLYTPRDFDISPYFQIVKYPFLDISQNSDFRLLPWQKSNYLLTEDEAHMYMSKDEMKHYKRIKNSHSIINKQRKKR